MTRQEIVDEYGIDENGMIASHGKFNGGACYTPYFYDATLDGCAEELSRMEDGCSEYIALVEIDDEDRREFPEVGNAVYAAVVENDQGFVSVALLDSEDEANEWRREYDCTEENSDDD